MLFWFLLFLIILIISLFLALYSLKDYREIPAKLKATYSVYLIRKPQEFTTEVLNEIHNLSLSEKLIFSLETLFKGDKKAFVIFGSTSVLGSFVEKLGLLELEDYSQQHTASSVWEVGLKSSSQGSFSNFKLPFPKLMANEQFWWQLVIQPFDKSFWGKIPTFLSGASSRSTISSLSGEVLFQTLIRAVIVTDDAKQLEGLQSEFSSIGENIGLARLPQPYTSSQIMKFYQQRAFSPLLPNHKKKSVEIILHPEEVRILSSLTTS